MFILLDINSAAPAVNWNGGRTSFPRADAWGGSRSEMSYSTQNRTGWIDRASSGGDRYRNRYSNYGGRGGGFDDFGRRGEDGYGTWKDGVHKVAPKNLQIERELFGSPDDPDRQHTGINFEKYDDIPVEASGNNVPEGVSDVCYHLFVHLFS